MLFCRACGASQLAYDEVGSPVCTSCGTLVDPAQTVLASHIDHPSTLSHVSPRTSRGWHLAQTKQERDRRNTMAMSTFIGAVLSKLNNPGLSPRAEAIFTQAMAKGHYRWGRRAKLTAGASIAIALREARKSDSLHDVAFLLDESSVSLSRALRSVISLLDLALTSTDPAVHLPILRAHLQSVIHPETPSPSSPSQLPKPLFSVLTTLSLQAAVRTATSLSHIISRQSPPLALANLPTPPTACALLILGLEAEARATLPHLGDLTRTLATRFALSPGVVASRYKILYDLIEEWIRHVPWLDQFMYKGGKGRRIVARSKVPKRTIVAKGIKDVVHFHEEIRLSRTQNRQKVELRLEPELGDVEEDEDEDDNGSINAPTVVSPSQEVDGLDMAPPPGKQRKVDKKADAMQAAHRFLLDPLSSGSLDVTTPNGEVGDVSLLTHILTCSPDELSRVRGAPPTRLQLLAVSRGGSTAEHISDEELFTSGELEGLLRGEQEREALRPLFQLNWAEEISTEEVATSHRNPIVSEPKRGGKRINMDALARLLGSDFEGDSTDPEDARFPDPDDDACCYLEDQVGGAGVLVSDWRPTSPDDDVRFENAAEERYDKEL